MVLIEALAFGIPVACTELSVFREVLSHTEAAFFSVANLNSVAGAINRASGERATLGARRIVRFTASEIGASI